MVVKEVSGERFTRVFRYESLPVELKKGIVKYAIPQQTSFKLINSEPWNARANRHIVLARNMDSIDHYVNINKLRHHFSVTALDDLRAELSTYFALLRIKVISNEAQGTLAPELYLMCIRQC
jgi:hypothetical protein